MKFIRVLAIGFGLIAPVFIVGFTFHFGICSLVENFDKTYFYAILGTILVSIIVYGISVMVIRKKRKFFNFEEPDEAGEVVEPGGGDIQHLHETMCPGCERDGFFFSDLDETVPKLLICWKCRKEFSEVWCNRCGMGGHFVSKIASGPSSWKCPKCKTEYELPEDFYDRPVALTAWENLPVGVRKSYIRKQRQHQIRKAGLSIYIFAMLIISYLLSWGYLKVVKQTFTTPLALCGIWLFVWLGTWFGSMFYPLLGYRLYNKLRNNSSSPLIDLWS